MGEYLVTILKDWGDVVVVEKGLLGIKMFDSIHEKIHELEVLLRDKANDFKKSKVGKALEDAHDNLVHQVAEYVRTAEARLERDKQ